MPTLDATDWFPRRHIGPSADERDEMLQVVGAASLDALVDEAIPAAIPRQRPLNLPPAESEQQYLQRLTKRARGTRTLRSYNGLGYHDTITPRVLPRMKLENPCCYT